LKELEGKAKECVLNCLESKDENECPQKVQDARKHFHNLNNNEKKKFIEKVVKEIQNKHPRAPKESIRTFLVALFGPRNIKPEQVCELYNRLFQFEQLNVESECPEKVVSTRKHFSTLNDKQKREFVIKVAKKLQENHPNTNKEHIRTFMIALFSPRNIEPKKVCELYSRLFQ
jgi:uncharacterized protein (DUF2267 family)